MTSREHIAGEKRAFDVSWFIPALVKYRKPLRDVLVGSFFLQLVGLASPIFWPWPGVSLATDGSGSMWLEMWRIRQSNRNSFPTG